jgi:hypothetical protein
MSSPIDRTKRARNFCYNHLIFDDPKLFKLINPYETLWYNSNDKS